MAAVPAWLLCIRFVGGLHGAGGAAGADSAFMQSPANATSFGGHHHHHHHHHESSFGDESPLMPFNSLSPVLLLTKHTQPHHHRFGQHIQASSVPPSPVSAAAAAAGGEAEGGAPGAVLSPAAFAGVSASSGMRRMPQGMVNVASVLLTPTRLEVRRATLQRLHHRPSTKPRAHFACACTRSCTHPPDDAPSRHCFSGTGARCLRQ